MLISIDSGDEITQIPHRKKWDEWRGRLTNAQWTGISDELRRRTAGSEVHTAGWIPGNDWRGTPFQSIYDVACRGNFEAARLCFGLCVWVFMMEHDAKWGCIKYDRSNAPIQSMIYFRLGDAEADTSGVESA